MPRHSVPKHNLVGLVTRAVSVARWRLLQKHPAPLCTIYELSTSQERNRTNNGAYQTLLPWSGEFAGKYLTHCVQLFRLTGDAELKTQIIKSFQLLQEYQAENGYMGTVSRCCSPHGNA